MWLNINVIGWIKMNFERLLKAKAKAKASDSYIARLTRTKHDQPRFTIIGSGS